MSRTYRLRRYVRDGIKVANGNVGTADAQADADFSYWFAHDYLGVQCVEREEAPPRDHFYKICFEEKFTTIKIPYARAPGGYYQDQARVAHKWYWNHLACVMESALDIGLGSQMWYLSAARIELGTKVWSPPPKQVLPLRQATYRLFGQGSYRSHTHHSILKSSKIKKSKKFGDYRFVEPIRGQLVKADWYNSDEGKNRRLVLRGLRRTSKQATKLRARCYNAGYEDEF